MAPPIRRALQSALIINSAFREFFEVRLAEASGSFKFPLRVSCAHFACYSCGPCFLREFAHNIRRAGLQSLYRSTAGAVARTDDHWKPPEVENEKRVKARLIPQDVGNEIFNHFGRASADQTGRPRSIAATLRNGAARLSLSKITT